MQAQQVPLVINWLSLSGFADNINVRGLLEVAFEQIDLPTERILYTEEEVKTAVRERQAQIARANLEAMIQELTRQGMSPEQIQQQLLLLIAQAKGGQGALFAPQQESAPPKGAIS